MPLSITGVAVPARARHMGPMTANDLQDLIVNHLTRESGGSRRRWRSVVGPVLVYDLKTHAHCNWSVRPSGDSDEIAVVELLLDRLRLDHPIVTGE